MALKRTVAGPEAPGGVAVWRDRFLVLPGSAGPRSPSQLRVYFLILFMGVGCELCFELSNVLSSGARLAVSVWTPAFAIVAAALFWLRRGLRTPFVIMAAVLWIRVIGQFPETANHHYLEALLFSLGGFLRRDDPDEAILCEQAIRWLAVCALAWAGIQKLYHGQYFDGQLLAFLTSQRENFAAVFQFTMPGDELARLRRLAPEVGAGPFRADSTLFVGISNFSMYMETATGLGLLVAGLRRWAAVGAMGLVFFIELAAHELFFGALMAATLLLFLDEDRIARTLPVFAIFYLYLFSMVIGILPRWNFH